LKEKIFIVIRASFITNWPLCFDSYLTANDAGIRVTESAIDIATELFTCLSEESFETDVMWETPTFAFRILLYSSICHSDFSVCAFMFHLPFLLFVFSSHFI
jgi:hypothetical protein